MALFAKMREDKVGSLHRPLGKRSKRFPDRSMQVRFIANGDSSFGKVQTALRARAAAVRSLRCRYNSVMGISPRLSGKEPMQFFDALRKARFGISPSQSSRCLMELFDNTSFLIRPPTGPSSFRNSSGNPENFLPLTSSVKFPPSAELTRLFAWLFGIPVPPLLPPLPSAATYPGPDGADPRFRKKSLSPAVLEVNRVGITRRMLPSITTRRRFGRYPNTDGRSVRSF
mmetsp:Transcript_27442/g.57972  ORF Transcript_27442/g.57972 Transcript_27442/m.57972 type:complete len:228 (-) Transcript_27442:59-742(-)